MSRLFNKCREASEWNPFLRCSHEGNYILDLPGIEPLLGEYVVAGFSPRSDAPNGYEARLNAG